MEYVWVPLLMPFAVIMVVGYFAYSSRNRYRTNIFQSRTARYVAILILLAISLPIFVSGVRAVEPRWARFDMILSYILLGLAATLLYRPVMGLLTWPVRSIRQARRKFQSNILTYGTVGVGSYLGTGESDTVNGVAVKWKMRFTFTDEGGRTHKEISAMFYKKDEIGYFKKHDFAIKILGRHAVVTETPFEKTKTQAQAKPVTPVNVCKYCGAAMDPKSPSCLSCGAKR